MNCTHWEEKLNAAQDGELEPRERASLDAHLESCADCRRTRDVLLAQGRELATAFAPLRAESDLLAGRIIAAVHAEPRPRRSFGRFGLLAAAAAALIAALFLRQPIPHPIPHPIPPPIPEPPLAVLALSTGPVEVRSSDRWVALPHHGAVSVGDAIRTVERSKCELSFTDGSVLRLNGSTEVEIKGPRFIHLKEGELFARVVPQPSVFRFTTDQCRLNATAGVLDLSHVERPAPRMKLDRSEPISTVTALEGRTRMAVSAGEQEVLPANACEIAGGIQAPPEPVDPFHKTRWIHDLLRLKPQDDPELPPRVRGLLTMLGKSKTPQFYEGEIRALGDRSVPTLLALVTNLPAEMGVPDRHAAARMLSDLGGPPEIAAFVKLARDPDPDVSAWAIGAVVRITGVALKTPDACDSWFRENREVWSCPHQHDRK